MELLKRAKRWFLDGTFRIVKSPFMQLWSIHAMIRVKNEMKQVPLAFVLMSRRTRRDYEKVLKLIYEVIFLKRARVVEVVCDFEKAVWQAVHLVLPFVQVKGCGFHWTQCLFRQLKKLGLVSAYRSDKNVKILCKQVLCLHLLPVCKIENAFSAFSTQCLQSQTIVTPQNSFKNGWGMCTEHGLRMQIGPFLLGVNTIEN
jgi:hypothetical protein